MRLKNILITVADVERSKRFYRDVFGLCVVLDNGSNVIMTEGLVLQERKIWEDALGREVLSRHAASELYFEERAIEAFVEKLEHAYPSVVYVTKLTAYDWGKKIVRFYDPDGHLIEVGTPM